MPVCLGHVRDGRQQAIAWLVLLSALCLPVQQLAANTTLARASGAELMQAVYDRHRQFPHVYEELSMVLIDRTNRRNARRLRRYTRAEADGEVSFLIVMDAPREVSGVGLLAKRSSAGVIERAVYLPGLGRMVRSARTSRDVSFLGTDFSIESLSGEALGDYRYVRGRDERVGDVTYFVVDVYPHAADAPLLRRHFIHKGIQYIVRTDYYNDLGRVSKRQTHHDLKAVDGDMWRADMLVMSDAVAQHQTIIKVDRRVFSKDYVPEEVFTERWLVANRPRQEVVVAQGPGTNAASFDYAESAAEAELMRRFAAAERMDDQPAATHSEGGE